MSITSGVGLVSQEDKFGRVIAGDSYKNYLLLKPNDFAYNKSSTKEYPEGFLTLYSGSDLAAVPNSIFTCFRVNGESPDTRFLNYQFSDNLHGRWLRNFIQVGARANGALSINDGDLMALPVPMPSGITAVVEQKKIADCLSSLDELIAAQARKVEALKTHKKGLMQKIFPREGETQPHLRFPEFQNSGDWEEQSVGDFGKVVTGNTPSTAQPAFYGGGIPFASPADISELRFIDQTKTTLTPEGFAETRPIRAGSVLFVCIGSTIGKVAQNIRDCATNQQINAVVPNSKHSDSFVYYALSFASERISVLAGRQAVPIINKSLFSSVRILAPKLSEQQRIASCLGSLDTLITAETQKLDTLKTQKKGLMQQLFPRLENSV
jgi:type I restriction enzyme S subunit